MTHLDDENGCCNWATSAAAKGSARVPLVHEKAPLIGGAFSLFVPPPVAVVTFCFRPSPLSIASCNFKANAVSSIKDNYEVDHSTP